jgi:hypothetical protein
VRCPLRHKILRFNDHLNVTFINLHMSRIEFYPKITAQNDSPNSSFFKSSFPHVLFTRIKVNEHKDEGCVTLILFEDLFLQHSKIIFRANLVHTSYVKKTEVV